MRKISKKRLISLNKAVLAVALSVTSVCAMQDTMEARQMASEGFNLSVNSMTSVQHQAHNAAMLLNADDSMNTVSSLPAAVAAVGGRLGMGMNGDASLIEQINSLTEDISGVTGYSLSGTNLSASVSNVWAKITPSHGASLSSDITSVVDAIHSNAASVSAAIADVREIVGGADGDLYSKAQTIASDIGDSSTLKGNVDAVSNALDNGIVSLPNGVRYVTVNSLASNNAGAVNIVVSSSFQGVGGIYSLPGSTFIDSISFNSSFTISNGSNSITFRNTRGRISTADQLLSYLASMYPVSSKMTIRLSDKVSSVKTMLGGSAQSVRTQIANIDASLLNTPTGVVFSDLATLRGLIVSSPQESAEEDVRTINSLLDGTPTNSTIQGRIGQPTVNGSASNLETVIGGTGNDLAELVGDPFTSSSGLAQLINAPNAANTASVFSDVSLGHLTSAESIHAQLNAFVALFDPSNWQAGNASITFTFTSAPTSLADIIAAASATA